MPTLEAGFRRRTRASRPYLRVLDTVQQGPVPNAVGGTCQAHSQPTAPSFFFQRKCLCNNLRLHGKKVWLPQRYYD